MITGTTTIGEHKLTCCISVAVRPAVPCVMFAACVLGISFDKARAFDLGSETSQGQGQVKVVREQLMTEDTKDVELSVDDVTDRICAYS